MTLARKIFSRRCRVCRALICLALLSLPITLRAQSTQLPLRFEHITVEDGLAHNRVWRILQDSKGFLWFATGYGLSRYDGYKFTNFRQGGAGTLSHDAIWAILEDHAGTLWAGRYGGGLNKFDAATQTFTCSQHDPENPNSLSNNVVRDIHELSDEPGILWIATTGGGTERATFTTLQSDIVQIEQRSIIRGTLIALHAKVRLERDGEFKGALYANKIRIDAKVKFQPHGSSAPFAKPSGLDGNDAEEITAEDAVVTDYALEQNYPNPFSQIPRFAGNPTTIRFDLPDAGEMSLSIYNMSGQLVKKLVAGEMNAGRHNVVWDATNDHGARVASGVYLYVIKAGTFTAHRKLVLMK